MTADATLLDNAVWHALHGPHARFAETFGRARRYPAAVAPFGAVDGFDDDAWSDLATLDAPAPTAVLFRGDIPTPPSGWDVAFRGEGHQMVLDELLPAPLPTARQLEVGDVAQMLDLVERTQPGPFRARTIELGAYHGVFDGDQLVAMAGERFRLPGFTEVSGVCTTPEARGRGLAAGLTTLVAQRILERGDVPFLHHTHDNHAARRVYERLGFRYRRAVAFVSFQPPRATAHDD